MLNAIPLHIRIAVLLAAVVFTGCATQPRVDGSWMADADQDQSFSRILVVGLSPNANARCEFESFLTNQLRKTIDAKASCLLMKTTEPLTREAIERVIDEYQPDAVLTTSLVDSSVTAEEGGDRDSRGGAQYKATGRGWDDPSYTGYGRRGYYGGYGVWGVPVVYVEFQTLPVVTSLEGEITILSMLYATDNASKVYEILTSASNLNSRENALASITRAIGDDLRSEKLVSAE